jgi:DNA-binding transcriptional LysR family regulator
MEAKTEMRVFARVVERGSFSAAADDLGITPSAVSKLIARLEERLAVRLLHRTTRRLALTPEGETYHLRARDILAAIEDAETEVSQTGAPRGRLRVSSVVPFVLHYLAPALPDFLARYPNIDVEIAATDRIVDLLADNADIGIRTGPVDDPSLVVRRIGHVERRIFAAPAYLARHGTPRSPDQLADHVCIRISPAPGHRWHFHVGGQPQAFEIPHRIVVDSSEAALQLAVAGVGIVRLADIVVGHAVRAGQLVQVLADHCVVEPVQLSAVYPLGRQRMPKVRAFIDFLVERFGHCPWRGQAKPAAANRRNALR